MQPNTAVARLFVGAPLSGKSSRLVQAFLDYQAAGFQPGQILLLSFYQSNAAALRRALRPHVGEYLPSVTFIQQWLVDVLSENAVVANLPGRPRPINPAARSLLVQQAWAECNGPLWKEFGERPGAIREVTRVLDWITQNRTRFTPAPGEFGSHELAQVYLRYIQLLINYRVLTFQETTLRALDLLADEAIRANLLAQFPVLLVDDLHLARPDQIAVISRLSGPSTWFAATAWLEPNHHAPELRHVWERIQQWGPIEHLANGNHRVNPVVQEIAAKACGAPRTITVSGEPVMLSTPFTVEAEMHSVARTIVHALVQDESLHPEDILVSTPDANLIPFAQRVLALYGLPVAPLQAAPRHTPLVRGGLLVLHWLNPSIETDDKRELERELFELPFLRMDLLDLAALVTSAKQHDRTLFDLTEQEWPSLQQPERTRALLERVKQYLTGLDHTRAASQIALDALRDLGGLQWAWETTDFPRAQGDAWVSTLSRWLAAVVEVEEMARTLNLEREAFLDLVEGLSDQVSNGVNLSGTVQILDSAHLNGVSGRLNFVVGLSESVVPARAPELQLLPESELPNLFVDGHAVVLPAVREHAAWIEREGRKLAELVTRGRERLYVSVSHYTTGGSAQLPSPFFERLLTGEGQIDRDGQLVLHTPRLWRQAQSGDAASDPASLLPYLERPFTPSRSTSAAQVLHRHAFSASQLKSYLTCPLQFFYARVLGIETAEGDIFARGAFIHEILCATMGDGRLEQVYLKRRKRPDWMNDSGPLAARAHCALDAAWGGTAADLPGGGRYTPTREWGPGFGPKLQRDAIYRWARGALTNWAEFEVEGMPDAKKRQPAQLEVPFTFHLDGYEIHGRIDRIDEIRDGNKTHYEVIDYKTGNAGADSLPTQIKKFLPEADDPPSDYQLPIYALAMLAGCSGKPVTPRALHYVNVEKMEKTSRAKFTAEAFRTIQLTPKGAVNYKAGRMPLAVLQGPVTDGIRRTIEAMTNSPYLPTPSNSCGRCNFRAACDRGHGAPGEAA